MRMDKDFIVIDLEVKPVRLQFRTMSLVSILIFIRFSRVGMIHPILINHEGEMMVC